MKFKFTYGILFSLYISQAIPSNFFMAAFPVMLRQHGASLELIGSLNLLLIPMSLRFLWAPFIDRAPSYKAWILPMQLICFVLMFWLGHIDWIRQYGLLFLIAFLYTLASGTQDIGVDGIAVRALAPEERSTGNAYSIAGKYLGTIIGAGAMLMLWDHITFEGNITFLLLVLAVPIILLRFYREPRVTAPAPHSSWGSIWQVFARKDMRMWYVLLLCLDGPFLLAGTMLRPLLVDRGFGMESLGFVLGILGSVAGITGCIIAPRIINWLGRENALILSGGTQLVQILVYLAIAVWPMGTAAIYSLLFVVGLLQGYGGIIIYTIVIDKSDPRTAATDFVVQATVFGFGVSLAGMAGGIIAQHLGYTQLFVISIALQVVLLGFLLRVARACQLSVRSPQPAVAPEPAAS